MSPRKKLPVQTESIVSRTENRLAPSHLVFCAFCVSFILPNIVYSGVYFFDTLHMMKWAAALVPLALLGVFSGFQTARLGPSKTNFRFDAFAIVWFFLLLYVSAQPLWSAPRSSETFYREWFFFASLWLTYTLSSILITTRLLRTLLWGALLNAVLSVFFAELQMRGMQTPYPFIMYTPGEYLANTGQQNMFALWMAIAGLGGVFLFLSSPPVKERPFVNLLLFAALAVVFHGLIVSTSRSGILSLAVGAAVLVLFFTHTRGKKLTLPKTGLVLLLFLLLLTVNVSTNERTGSALASKLEDVVRQPLSIAKRDSIWATSWTMFANQPWKGVGLGQFKWNYLDAQRDMLLRWPHLEWQYTHWAHNEFLQWMAETGIPGAALMFLLWGWWGYSALKALLKKKPLSPEAVWGSALVALFFFNALWTRPFHRIENALWLALAFAVTNRELLRPVFSSWLSPARMERPLRVLGALIGMACIAGLLYLGDGVRGDRLLRLAAERAGGDATATKNLYKQAFSSPMVRDVAVKETGYFSVELGQSIGNAKMIEDGLNVLLGYFKKNADIEEYTFLKHWARTTGNERLIHYLDSFVPLVNAPDAQSEDASEGRSGE